MRGGVSLVFESRFMYNGKKSPASELGKLYSCISAELPKNTIHEQGKNGIFLDSWNRKSSND